MPLAVPGLPGANNPISPMAKPSDEHLLMAAADMAANGRLSRPAEQPMPKSNPAKRPVRRLKVIK